MEQLSFREFHLARQDYDESVKRTPGIAGFCSSSDWVIAAHEQLHPERDCHFFREGEHWVMLTSGPAMGYAQVLQPLEALWSFSCPLLGPSPQKRVALLMRALVKLGGDFPLVYLGGIPQNSPLEYSLRLRLAERFRVFTLPGCDCQQASLAEGEEGFLARRSGKFRAELRRAERKAEQAGVRFELLREGVEAEEVLDRILAIESRTWKWEQGESIFQSDAYSFYRYLVISALRSGRLRVTFAKRGDEDMGYAFGAVFGSVFRGLQMSYAQEHGKYGLGNLAQWQLVQNAVSEGLQTYDLGMVIDYKSRWAEGNLKLVNLLALAR